MACSVVVGVAELLLLIRLLGIFYHVSVEIHVSLVNGEAHILQCQGFF